MTPYFSIIIPLYNKELFILNTLNSVLQQTFTDFEIIIVNDGSTDHSLDKINTLKDDRIHMYSIENNGVSHARNFGIKKCKSNNIAFLDADDFWEKHYLKEMSILIETYPTEHVFASAVNISTSKKTYKAIYPNIIKNQHSFITDYFSASQSHSLLTSSSVVIKKEAILKTGEFDESLSTGEDTDYWIRLGLNYNIVFTNSLLVTICISDDSLTKSNRKNFKSIEYSKYDKQASQNPHIAKFLNRNRFSSVIKYKIINDRENFNTLRKELSLKDLTYKQRLMLKLPNWILKSLIDVYFKWSYKKKYY